MPFGYVPQQFVDNSMCVPGTWPAPVGSFQVANPGLVGGFQTPGNYVIGAKSQNLQQVCGTQNCQGIPAVGPVESFQAGPVGRFQAISDPQCAAGAEQILQGVPQQFTVPAPDPSPDRTNEAWLTKDAAMRRRVQFGLDVSIIADFIESCEFVSLGNFCGVARALQALDVKKYAYPFDWLRSPTFGVIHCLETDFEDFLTYTVARDEGPKGHLFGSTHWGGSFWHHNIVTQKTKDDFVRRIERFYGNGEVPRETSRVFVRALNSTRELDDCVRLHQALKRALPSARRIYLLVLLDMQSDLTPARLQDYDDTLLFCKVHESLFANNGAQWSMEKQGVAYAEQIAFAISVWCGELRAKSQIRGFSDIHALGHACDSFEGGSCAIELFFPRKFQGQMIKINSRSQPRATRTSSQNAESPRVSGGGTGGPGIVHRLKSLQARLMGSKDGNSDDGGELYFSDAQERGRQRQIIPAPIEQEMRYRPLSRSLSRSKSQERDLPSQGRINGSSVPEPVQAELGWVPGQGFLSREASPHNRYGQRN